MCSITSQSLSVAQTLVVPESTEDILSKGFTSLEMEEERIETAQQVNGSVFSKVVSLFWISQDRANKNVLIKSSEHLKL